jgi:hypothetical protein
MHNTKLRNILFPVVLLLLLSGNISQAQIAINSPYTRYGLGWLVENRFETRMMAMGGLRYGVQHPWFINPANPASYVAYDSTSFVFQGGVFGTSVRLKNDQVSGEGNFLSMSHLLFGFPVTKWWGTSFGVLPYSYVGYDILVETEVEDVGLSRTLLGGSGGFNKVYWGNAFKIYKGLSAGFNFVYLFGEIERIRAIGFPDNVFLRNTRERNSFNANDFLWDFGLQYRHQINNKHTIAGGITYSNETRVNSVGNSIVTAYYGDINSVLATRDTISIAPEVKGDFTVPTKIGVGITFEEREKWVAGIDFKWQNWDNFQIFGLEDSLQNSWEIAAGGEYIPNIRTIRSYWEAVSYRFGFRFGTSYLKLRDTDLTEFGISFGLGFPIRRSRTSLNLAVEAGKLGTIDNGLIQENFVRFTFGVNIFENWFMKRKYY